MFAQIIIKLIKHERNVRIHQAAQITARPIRKIPHGDFQKPRGVVQSGIGRRVQSQ